MTRFLPILTEEEAWQVLRYVRSFAAGEEVVSSPAR